MSRKQLVFRFVCWAVAAQAIAQMLFMFLPSWLSYPIAFLIGMIFADVPIQQYYKIKSKEKADED